MTAHWPAKDEVEAAKSPVEQLIKKYLKNAYMVYSGQKPYAVVALLNNDVARKTNIPLEVMVRQIFFGKMARSRPEIIKDKLFTFVKTLNKPEEIYQLPGQQKLNFFRTLEDGSVNLVGTSEKGEGADAQQIITSFITKNKRYLGNIKRTAEAVYTRSSGGAACPSSVMLSPPAGQLPEGISGVRQPVSTTLPENSSLVNSPSPKSIVRRHE